MSEELTISHSTPTGPTSRLQPDSLRESALPSVAVIIPNHDRTDELHEALASVANQDYPGVVRVYLVYQERSGIGPLLDALGPTVTPIPFRASVDRNPIASKRNIGLDAAAEELAAFLDDDDVWHPTKLSLQVAAFLQDTSAVAVCTRFVTFTEEPTWPARFESPRFRPVSRHATLRGGAIVTSSLVVRARAVPRLRFDERPNWLAVEDYDLKIQLRESGRVWRVEAPLTGIRVANVSSSGIDRRSQSAKGLSVLAASGRHGTNRWLRRVVALECMPVAVLASAGATPDAATTELAEALDGRLFGRFDGIVAAVVRRGWRSRLVASFGHTLRARLRQRKAKRRPESSATSASPPVGGSRLRQP